MNLYPIDAAYKCDFKFIVTFNNNEIKEIDIRNLGKIDKRYEEYESFKVLQDENFVKHMKIEGPTLSHKNIDIAPEILYQLAI